MPASNSSPRPEPIPRAEYQAPLARRDDIYWLGNQLLDFADTAVAHLAGGLGVPEWILLPHIPDWRWLLTDDTTGWYDSARLFQQEKSGDWDSVLYNLRLALTRFPELLCQ